MNDQDPVVHRWFNGGGREAQTLCGTTHSTGIPLRVCRGDEQDQLGIGRQQPDLAQEPGLDQVTDGQGVRQRSVIQEVFGRQLAAQLHEGQRISPGDGDDPFRYSVTDGVRNRGTEQTVGRVGIESADPKLRNALERRADLK